ncbi:hypothetical protein QFC22_005825 [Naganishia vaughanmartiniae]|uniref:Uncharacterized protein n=1 Tax=Naganishia vaughanmartiniae TaxID=1424756 RepID=A0ACC2WQV4_9TREE|nr:hypothetical protein QFC22_005825 [Naganishia vaughanmartiniae]
MSSNERQPLLSTTRRQSSHGGANASPAKKFAPLQSSRHLITGSWMNLLLLSDATEQLSMSMGQTLAGILNATFGNAVELIVGIVALQQDQLRLVQTSMLGSILSNLLLVLGKLKQYEKRQKTPLIPIALFARNRSVGCSFAAGGFVYSESAFRQTAAQTSASLMTLSCITLVIPAAYHSTYNRGAPNAGNDLAIMKDHANPEHAPNPKDDSLAGLLKLSRGTSIILLSVYFIYLYFQLKSHSKLFEAEQAARQDGEEEEEEEVADMDTYSAGFWLAAVTVVTAFCADVLVGSIDETASKWHIPKPFIGKMELTIGVSVGSSIQIAAGMIPILTLLAWPMGKPLTLYFADFETIALFVSVILVSGLLNDGSSNYMEGVMLVALYLVIALSYAVS